MNSSNFTIQDIHSIRFENYEKTKDMSSDKLIRHTKQASLSGLKRLDRLRKPSNEGLGNNPTC